MKLQNRFRDDMIDYLAWRGDVRLSTEQPLNEVDQLILARFSYFPFNHIALAPRESVKSFSEKMLALRKNYFNQPNDHSLVESLSHSERFLRLICTDYVRHNDKLAENQFGAITIHLPNNELCLSYIGTDTTFEGWKEDFNMTFMPVIPAQEQALQYLEHIATKYPTHRLRLCGHSKGGNVAVFAALATSTAIQKHILSVTNFDGPGFLSNLTTFHRNADILAKIHNYIPQGSMIGRLLQQDGKRTVTFSRETGILQHDIYSWEILGPRIKRSPRADTSSDIFDKTIIDLLKSRNYAERKDFVDTIYDILSNANFTDVNDMRTNWVKRIPSIVKNYRNIKAEDRELVTKVIKQLASLYLSNRKQTLSSVKRHPESTKTSKIRRQTKTNQLKISKFSSPQAD